MSVDHHRPAACTCSSSGFHLLLSALADNPCLKQLLLYYYRATVTNSTNWVAKITQMEYLTVLEAKSPRPRCHQGWFPLRLWGRTHSTLPPGFWWFAGDPWLVDVSPQCVSMVLSLCLLTSSSLCMSVSVPKMPRFVGISVIGLGLTLLTSF